MAITIKLFAQYRDILGQCEITMPSRPGLTVQSVYDEVIGDRAAAELRQSTKFAVNEAFTDANTIVTDGDRVAFIPPVSGG